MGWRWLKDSSKNNIDVPINMINAKITYLVLNTLEYIKPTGMTLDVINKYRAIVCSNRKILER